MLRKKTGNQERAYRLLTSVSAAVALLALASCGGGGDGGSSESLASDDEVVDPNSDGASDVETAQDTFTCANRNNNTFKKLLECVDLAGVRGHQLALQRIADRNGGTRVSGTPGYDQSAAYAENVFRRAGYQVTRQEFEFQTFVQLTPTVLERVSPAPAGPIVTNVLSYSGSGDVTAPVSTPAGIFGCTAADFAGFTAGNIALVSRGNGCSFAIKVTNAVNAGAVGVVIYNNVAGPLNGTLGNDFTLDVAATSVTQAVGQQLAATPNLVLHIRTNTFRGIARTSNVFAESQKGDADKVVMVGAHLDSVDAGPGINDNGSGTAAVLEVAKQMGKVKPRNKVRFALWGAEEAVLVGSTHYVENLTEAERNRIALYLNFDMIGSPNPGYFIYDGDNSDNTGSGPGPAGSAEIEKAFESFYMTRNVQFEGTDFDGRSDYGPFIAVGIPSGGLFSGAEVAKTPAQAAKWGGTAGLAFDPCYHQACDTINNVSLAALAVNSDAVAYTTLLYATAKELPGAATEQAQRATTRGSYKAPPRRGHGEPPVTQ